MKRHLIKNNIMLMIGAFLVFFLVVMISLYSFWQQQTKSMVSLVLEEVQLEYESYDGTPLDFVQDYQTESGRRITILDEQGIVLADSHDPEVGQDKSGRPEIKHLGTVATRNSLTIGIELVYMATRLDDQNILRVSIPLQSQALLYSTVLWIVLGVSIVIVTIYYFGLLQVNKNLLAPWEKVKVGLQNLAQGNYQVMALTSPYPEINDLLHEMNQINLETDKHLRSIETYQIQLKEILNELKQGVMLFDQHESLVYFNDDAKHEFELAEEAYDKPSYYMIRDLAIKQAISDVNHDRQNRVFDVKHEGKTLEIKVFHVDAEGHNKTKATVLVLVKDVTQERAIEQIKRDFFSHASHELKSPLTAIKGLAELIEQHMVTDAEIDKTAQKIVKQTETMTALVEDMLMLSRLENLKEKSYVKIDVVKTLQDVVESLRPLADSKSIKLHTKTTPFQGFCDPIDLQKLFKNLIENAIKYSEDNKKVDITLSKEQELMVFSVKDQGIGIAVEHQQRVFERFYRVDKGRLDGGTGLGLAIVKHISMKYDGTIDLKSSLARGTTVTVKIHI